MTDELFSLSERSALDGFPDQVDMAAFWLSESDLSDVVGWRYSDPARLAAGLQIGLLRVLGFIPSDLDGVPKEAVDLVAGQLGLTPALLGEYCPPERTVRSHIAGVERHLGFRRCDQGDIKAAGDWLVQPALEHDRPITLFGLVCEHLRAERLVRPALGTLERLIAHARQVAFDETWIKLRPELTPQQLDEIDDLGRLYGARRGGKPRTHPWTLARVWPPRSCRWACVLPRSRLGQDWPSSPPTLIRRRAPSRQYRSIPP